MSRVPIRSHSIPEEFIAKMQTASVAGFREFLSNDPARVFGTRDARKCPLAQYGSKVTGEPMGYNTPGPGVIPRSTPDPIPWGLNLAVAVDKEPTETVTAERVLQIMDELGAVES